jgi:hypothetical protein
LQRGAELSRHRGDGILLSFCRELVFFCFFPPVATPSTLNSEKQISTIFGHSTLI